MFSNDKKKYKMLDLFFGISAYKICGCLRDKKSTRIVQLQVYTF